jgi:hypothetical protein
MLTMDQIERGFAEMRASISTLGASISTLAEALAAGLSQVRTDLRAEFGAMMESQRSEFRVMHDGLLDVGRRLDGVDKRLDGVDKRLDGVDKLLDGVDKRLDGVEANGTSVAAKLERVYRHLKLNGGPRSKRRR